MSSTTMVDATSASTSTSTSSDTITTIAMTGVFTAPSSCSHSWTYEPQSDNDVTSGLIAQNCAEQDGFNTACFPSGFNHVGRVVPSQVFSPGYCPQGYTAAGLIVSSSTTAATCCPSGFDTSTTGLDGGEEFMGCTSMFTAGSTIVPIIHSTAVSTELTGVRSMWAQPINVMWQEKDLSLFTTPASTSASTSSTLPSSIVEAAATSSTTATTSSTTTSASSGSSGSSGLSTGASVGVGVGVGIAAMAVLFGLAFWFLLRRRRAKPLVAELDGGYVARKTPRIRVFTRNSKPSELPLKNHEMQDRTHELSGTSKVIAHELAVS